MVAHRRVGEHEVANVIGLVVVTVSRNENQKLVAIMESPAVQLIEFFPELVASRIVKMLNLESLIILELVLNGFCVKDRIG
jgi:hypothetical protein